MNNEETVNQEETVKTFTQAEVDAIVGDRLKRDRAKHADYDALKEKADKFDAMEEANKSELQKAIERGDALQAQIDNMKAAEAMRVMRETVATETGVPASLLTGETEDDCREQAKSILDFAKPTAYPSLRDGGEVTHIGKPTTKQQFEEWAEKAFG